MSGGGEAPESILTELDALRRRLAQLEADALEHRQEVQQFVEGARASEAALRQSEATARAVLETASEGIILINATGQIVLVNAAAERMFGYDRTELMDRPLEILLPERIRAGHVDHRAGYFTEPRVRPMGVGLDLSGRRKDGTEFPVEISLSYVEAPDGRVAMAFILDVTERRRLEAQFRHQREVLYQNEKLAALGTLSAGIAHEMNNPLGIMLTRIELMLLDADEQHLPDQVREDLQVLHRAGQRVARIAGSLRSFAQQSAGERVALDLNAVVDETLLLMQKPLAADNVQVVTNLDRSLPLVLGDANGLHQVLMNLLTNAREVMPAGGEIRIDSERLDDPAGVRLQVADTGPGIPPEVISKIFDPFYTTKRTGTGLGLSVTYGIIKDHGGTIDVLSRPGSGTTFVLTFPAAGPAS